MNKSIIITGAAGTIAEAVIESLRNKYKLLLCDLKPHKTLPTLLFDLRDFDSVVKNFIREMP